ncbi:hypothetical protein lerEdw1_003054 [Lerista edwardsae]|nr:hypothetical protein lerEdw1_003054 [Lerista edwardsae]
MYSVRNVTAQRKMDNCSNVQLCNKLTTWQLFAGAGGPRKNPRTFGKISQTAHRPQPGRKPAVQICGPFRLSLLLAQQSTGMEVLPTFLLLLVGSLGSLAQEDLQGKTFIFPEESNTAHVVLRAAPEKPLISFTVCLRHATDLTRGHSLFSYNTKKQDNELLLFKPNANQYRLYVGGTYVTFKAPEKEISRPGEVHVCASWESATGIAELWLDGKLLPRKGLKRGYAIGQDASIVLAQEQDSFGGCFDVNQSFVGEISDVYMWESVLTPEEVALVGNDGVLSGYLIDWRLLDYEAKGYVVVKPSLASVYSSRQF